MSFIRRLIRGKVESTKEEIQDWSDPDGTEISMPCPEIELTGIDKVLHEKLMAQAVAAGALFEGDQVSLHGISLGWDWDEVSGTLHVTALKHPFYLTCSEIEDKIRELADKAKKEGI